MGAKTDQKINQKWRSKSKAILEGFGGPNGAKWGPNGRIGGGAGGQGARSRAKAHLRKEI